MAQALRVAQFTKYPGPRYRGDGPFSAEQFREEWLEPRLSQCLASGDYLEVVLDGVSGYGSSFLEESFGGLVRRGYTESQLTQSLRIKNETPRFEHHRLRAEQYLKDAYVEAMRQPRAMVG